MIQPPQLFHLYLDPPPTPASSPGENSTGPRGFAERCSSAPIAALIMFSGSISSCVPEIKASGPQILAHCD